MSETFRLILVGSCIGLTFCILIYSLLNFMIALTQKKCAKTRGHKFIEIDGKHICIFCCYQEEKSNGK